MLCYVEDKRKLNKKSLMTEFEWNEIDEGDNQRRKMIRTGIVIESRLMKAKIIEGK